jgi:hypothetical protein
VYKYTWPLPLPSLGQRSQGREKWTGREETERRRVLGLEDIWRLAYCVCFYQFGKHAIQSNLDAL